MRNLKSETVNGESSSPKKSIYDPLWAFPFKLIWKIIKFPVKLVLRILELVM